MTTDEQIVNLYDYYFIQFGYEPPEDFKKAFMAILINSPQGKKYKKTIDAFVAAFDTMTTQKFDKSLIMVITAYLVFEVDGAKAK